MLDFLLHLDKEVFLLLNGLHNNFFDFIMWWSSDKLIWVPLYLLFLYLIIKKYGWESVAIIISLAILIALSDQISGFIKDGVHRFRPSHNPDFIGQIRNLNGYLGGNYGFVSSHATNSFALAYFLIKILEPKSIYTKIFLFGWAAEVSYSRIYLGVHYPGDILGGALLGLFLAWLVVYFYQHVFHKICLSKKC